MAKQEKSWDNEELTDYVERLVEMQIEMNDLRKEAQGSGLQPPVLNWLVGQRANNPGDGGAAVVNELIRYAAALGMPLEGLAPLEEQEEELPRTDGNQAAQELERVTEESGETGLILARENRPRIPLSLKVAGECLAGLCLASGLIWLLHL